MKAVALTAALLAGITAFLTNLDKLGELWRKYFDPEPIAALPSPRNLPSNLFGSNTPVRVELVQAADQGSDERAYDLYLENSGANDLLLSEVRYGPGMAYASTADNAAISGAAPPTVSYSVVASGNRGTAALSPPYRLRAKANGSLRLVVEAAPGVAVSRGTVAFELYSADGDRVASVNRMLDK
ncbi:hypothetical protein [Cognatiluteimonas weifangensis]|uniref:hypothetical protein n=1 Tax=Cognatiluteimonas weifangensis TaxID=2303539 RepID=UPI0011C11D84|nr:hypothetical protein [Luteimonas weifangensis]